MALLTRSASERFMIHSNWAAFNSARNGVHPSAGSGSRIEVQKSLRPILAPMKCWCLRQQLSQLPHMIRQIRFHGGSDAQRLMNAAEIVVREVQAVCIFLAFCSRRWYTYPSTFWRSDEASFRDDGLPFHNGWCLRIRGRCSTHRTIPGLPGAEFDSDDGHCPARRRRLHRLETAAQAISYFKPAAGK